MKPNPSALRTIAILAGTFLVLGTLPLAAVADDHRDRDDDNSRSDKDRPEREFAGDRKPGRLVAQNGHLDGRYVAFTIDVSSCSILNYSVYGSLFLASIQIPAPCQVSRNGPGPSPQGSKLRLESDEARIDIHDAPNGLMKLKSDDAAIRIVPAPGVTVKGLGGDLTLDTSDLSGLLQADEEDAFRPDGPGWILEDASARFWVHPLKGNDPARQQIRESIKHGRVAAQVDVLLENGTTTSEVLAFQDVVVKVSKKGSAEYRFLIDGNLTSGRVFVLNFAPGAFEHERVAVRYFDVDDTLAHTSVAIAKADNLTDLMDIVPGEGPKFWIVKDDMGRHVLVAVPEFSVHVVELAGLDVRIVPVVIGGVVAAGLVVLAAGADLLRPRRRE